MRMLLQMLLLFCCMFYLLLLNDQPVTCPFCSSRTEYIDFDDNGELYQIHYCLNKVYCGHFFACVEE